MQFQEGDIVQVRKKGEKDVMPDWFLVVGRDESWTEADINKWVTLTEKQEGPVRITNLTTGQLVWAHDKRLVLVEEEKVQDYIAKVRRTRKHLAEAEYLKPGSICELVYDTDVKRREMFFSYTETLRKGTTLVVDSNSEHYQPGPDADPDKITAIVENRAKKVGDRLVIDLVMPWINFSDPSSNMIEDGITYQSVKAKTFDETPQRLIALPDGYLNRIESILSRVVNTSRHEEVYAKLGLQSFCQKGRGAIFLLYGPPGTGKTMTAEVVAEKIKRPLIRVNLGNLMNTDGVMDRLEDAFKKARKYNAVLLLDEIDVFIRKRGGDHPFFDENTAIFLRCIELFDGVLFLTTNLANLIDPAIFSRIHGVFEYQKQTPKDREVIWRKMLQEGVLKYVAGNDAQHHSMILELAEIELNGREIKTAIQNAITHAISELKGQAVQEVKWIPRHYFTDEAKEIAHQRESLKGV